jgi:membrane-associated phospholipid phosphatase
LKNKLRTSFNPYFFIPFLLWVVAGGVLLCLYTQAQIFRFVNTRYNDFLDMLMYGATWIGAAQVIIPALLLPMVLMKKYRTWWYFSLAAACNLVPLVIVQVLKSFLNKRRPMHFFGSEPWLHHLEHWEFLYERSFPSGHSEGTFSFFCFCAMMLPSRYRAWGLLFFVLAILVGYSRIYLAAHFFRDVYAGSTIGVASGTMAFVIMNHYFKKYFKNTSVTDGAGS